jgi:hypothetical protein
MSPALHEQQNHSHHSHQTPAHPQHASYSAASRRPSPCVSSERGALLDLRGPVWTGVAPMAPVYRERSPARRTVIHCARAACMHVRPALVPTWCCALSIANVKTPGSCGATGGGSQGRPPPEGEGSKQEHWKTQEKRERSAESKQAGFSCGRWSSTLPPTALIRSGCSGARRGSTVSITPLCMSRA